MDRMKLLADAFRAVPLTCGALQLRPLTAGSMMLLMETGNPLFTEQETDPGEAAMMQGIFEFIYIHTAPEDEVTVETEHPARLRAKARALSMRIGFEDLSAFTAQFELLRARLAAASVEVLPDKEAGKPAGATMATPPTGLPSSSTPSAAPEIPPGNITSFGGCPSSAPSNTSTPRTPQTESDSVGRSRIWEEPADLSPDSADPVIPLP